VHAALEQVANPKAKPVVTQTAVQLEPKCTWLDFVGIALVLGAVFELPKVLDVLYFGVPANAALALVGVYILWSRGKRQ
jgi:hypothetical protein